MTEEESGKKEGTSTEDSDEQYWRCDLQPPGESEQLLHYILWKSNGMSVNPDPRKFLFAIVYCYCDKYRNTMRGM